MLNLILWLVIFAGILGMILFAWRSAMRRRGFRLLKLLEGEEVLRYAVDIPMARGSSTPAVELLARRGTVVLTRKRLAGFAHRSRFVLVRGGTTRSGAVEADGGWLVVRPVGRKKDGRAAPVFRFQVPDAEGWSRDARRVLRI
jgi:hypothetical protein